MKLILMSLHEILLIPALFIKIIQISKNKKK